MATSIVSSFTRCQYVPQDHQEECQEEQYGLCPHCNAWLCLPHINEHQQILQTHAHTVNDHANQIRQQLPELNVDCLYDDCKKKIDEWREQLYAEINTRHTEMLTQLGKLHHELTEEVQDFKTKKFKSFTHEIVEPLTHMLTKQKQVHPEKLKTIETKLQLFEQKISDIKSPDLIHMNCDEIQLAGDFNFEREHPCDENQMTPKAQSLTLEVLNQTPAKRFSLESGTRALAASVHFILAYHQKPPKLLLFNTKTQLRTIDTTDEIVIDICWSDTMNLFLVAGSKLQTYDIISNNLVDIPINNSQVKSNIWAVTCHFRDVVLLHGNGIIQCYSYPSFTRKKMWLPSGYLEQGSDSKASSIRFNNNGVLAISIKQKDLHWRIDLFDMQLQRISRGVALSYETGENFGFEFISVINNEWLARDYEPKPGLIMLLDEKGAIKQHVKKDISSLAVMGKEILVLSDLEGLYLYKFPIKA